MIPVSHLSDSSRTSLFLLWRQTVRGLSVCLLSMVGKRHITNTWSSFNSTTSSCSSGVQTLSLLWVRWLWQGHLHPTTGLLINPMTCLHTRCVPLWADPSGMALEEDVCNMHVSKVCHLGPKHDLVDILDAFCPHTDITQALWHLVLSSSPSSRLSGFCWSILTTNSRVREKHLQSVIIPPTGKII